MSQTQNARQGWLAKCPDAGSSVVRRRRTLGYVPGCACHMGRLSDGLIHINAVFADIDPTRLDEFKALASELLQITNADDGVLQYDWYLTDDGTRCVVRETYTDSAAVIAHLPLVGEQLARIGELCGIVEGDVLGDATPDLQAMIEHTPAHLCRHLQSK